MNQGDESQEWVTKREESLNQLLYKSHTWSELMRCRRGEVHEGLCRLLKSLVYAIGSAEILETIVDQDVYTFCEIEERLQHKLQVIVFTQKRVCIGTLEKPDVPNSAWSRTLKRSSIKSLSLSVSEPAPSRQDHFSSKQHLSIIAEYNGLDEPLAIGCKSTNTSHYEDYTDGPSFLERMEHINQLIMENLNC